MTHKASQLDVLTTLYNGLNKRETGAKGFSLITEIIESENISLKVGTLIRLPREY